jgi:hypothetical protein
MLRLYYTTQNESEKMQDRPDLSLGGFKSSTPVPNASYNNLFGDVSVYSVYSSQEEYIGLTLKNDEETTVTDVRMWFDYPEECQKILEVAATQFNQSGQMEIIGNSFSRPLYSEFFPADGEEGAVDLGDIPAGGVLGIWFKKTVDASSIINRVSDENLFKKGNVEAGNEDIGIIFDWN